MTPTVLDFLSAAGERPDVRFKPLRRSPMERRLRDHGAELEERDGWLVATRVPGEDGHALGVRDVTHLYTVYEGENGGAWVQVGEGVLVHQVSTGHVFVARTAAAKGDPPEGFLDLSAAYAALEIEGPGAVTAMRRLTALDLGELPAVGPASHVRAWIFRPAEDRFVLFFPQEYGHYLWEVAVDVAEPLGGGPKA